jgi:hypothetical protein
MTQQPAFDEVLTALRREESEPTYRALFEWQQKYPQFRDDLEDYFANWATSFFDEIKFVDRDPNVDPNQQWLVEFGAAYARQIMGRQQAGIPDDRIEPLSEFEQLVLTAMKSQRTPRWQYLERITDTVREFANHHYLRSSVLEALQNLEARHLVFSWSPNPEKHPDEAGRTYFFVSSIGEASLKKDKIAKRGRRG